MSRVSFASAAALFIGTCPDRPFVLTCGRRMFRAAGTRMPWHPVPSRAALAVLVVRLLSGLVPIALGHFLLSLAFGFGRLFFIRNRRLAWIACFVFFNEEYLIALVDFIAPYWVEKRRCLFGFDARFLDYR